MKINWSNIVEQAIGTTISAVVLTPLLVSVYGLITGNAQTSSWLWFGLATLVGSFVVARAWQTFRRLLIALGHWIVGNWQFVVGVGLLASVAYGAFVLAQTLWAIALVLGLVMAVILLAQYLSLKKIQDLQDELEQDRIEMLPLNQIANIDDLAAIYLDPPMGEQWFNGVPFLLTASYFNTGVDGTRSAKLALNPPIARIFSVHILINAGNAWKRHKETALEGTVIGRIDLLFNDGTLEETKLILGQNVREWAPGNSPGALVDKVTDKSSKVAWIGKNSYQNEAIIDHLEIPVREHSRMRLVQIAIFKDTQPDTPQDTLQLALFAITLQRH